MATALTENIISKPNTGNEVIYSFPESSTATEIFSFKQNDSSDDLYIIVDASASSPGSYTLSFTKGDSPLAKTPSPLTISDGIVCFIPIESGLVEKKDGTSAFTVTTTITGGLVNTGLKIAVVKKRIVTNH